MSVKWLNWAFQLPAEVKGSARFLAVTLADCADDDGVSWYSVEKLQAKTALSERGVQDAAKQLIDRGLLHREINGKRSFLRDGHEVEIRAGHRPNVWQLLDVSPAESAGHAEETEGWGAESAGGGVQNLRGYRGAESAPNPSLEPPLEPSSPPSFSRSTQEGQPHSAHDEEEEEQKQQDPWAVALPDATPEELMLIARAVRTEGRIRNPDRWAASPAGRTNLAERLNQLRAERRANLAAGMSPPVGLQWYELPEPDPTTIKSGLAQAREALAATTRPRTDPDDDQEREVAS